MRAGIFALWGLVSSLELFPSDIYPEIGEEIDAFVVEDLTQSIQGMSTPKR